MERNLVRLAVGIAKEANIPEAAVRGSSHRSRKSFAEVMKFWSK
jgi:hypothetical protein